MYALIGKRMKHNGILCCILPGVDERGSKFIKPFYTPDDAQKAGCYSPDVMLPEERAAFPALVKYVNCHFS